MEMYTSLRIMGILVGATMLVMGGWTIVGCFSLNDMSNIALGLVCVVLGVQALCLAFFNNNKPVSKSKEE
jgi:uncharacterized membrane protein HdeD (DUF308 family)